jgi:hypothetical protein
MVEILHVRVSFICLYVIDVRTYLQLINVTVYTKEHGMSIVWNMRLYGLGAGRASIPGEGERSPPHRSSNQTRAALGFPPIGARLSIPIHLLQPIAASQSILRSLALYFFFFSRDKQGLAKTLYNLDLCYLSKLI